MIAFGLRLTLASGREAAIRLTAIAAGVALGVGLLLCALAGINAADTQNARNAWLNTTGSDPGRPASSSSAQPAESAESGAATVDPLWWLLRADRHAGEVIGRVDVAATGPRSPVPPGIPRLPGPGEYYASPALAALIRSTPATELGARFPGRQVGTIGAEALPGPDSLIAIIGHAPDQLAENAAALRVTSINFAAPDVCNGPQCDVMVGIDANGMALILGVVAVALVFPVVILIGAATRLSAARREQRFAAMRLVGATPRQISVIAAIESTVAAGIGVLAGFGAFLLFRPLLAMVNLTGTALFTSDLSLDPADVLLVGLGVPVASAITARLALRRVRISPLGVTRRATPRPPRAYRLLPLAAGLGELAFFIGRSPESTQGQILAYVSGALVVLVGIVVAGPWLTMMGARIMARRTGRPAVLLAGRRLSDDPKAGFRAVGGLGLALCVMTGATAVISTVVAEGRVPDGGTAAGDTLVARFAHDLTEAGEPTGSVPPPSDGLLARLRSLPGVHGVAVIRTNPLGTTDPTSTGPDAHGAPQKAGLVSCAELATMPVFSRCPAGARSASVTPDFRTRAFEGSAAWPVVWPAAEISTERLGRLPAQQIVVATGGATSVIEQVRTVLAQAYPAQEFPITIGELLAGTLGDLAGFQRLASVVILLSFPIAGCGLLVSVAGGLSERKRPFSVLRLTGVPLRVLRRVVLLESAVPLTGVAIVAIGTGFLAAGLFLKAQLDYELRAPDAGYYVLVLGGLTVSLLIIASALPLLSRITGPETARNE